MTAAKRRAIDQLPSCGHAATEDRAARPRPAGGGRHARSRLPGRPHRGRRPPAGLPVLPPVAHSGVARGADVATGRRADHGGDRARVRDDRVDDGTTDLPGEEDADRGAGGVRAADRRGPGTPAGRRDGGDLPRLQRGVLRDRRRGLDASGAGQRGHAAGPVARRPGARRARGARPAGAAGDPGVADVGSARSTTERRCCSRRRTGRGGTSC